MNELSGLQRLHVQQEWEGLEIIIGWETRNKYRILDQDLRPLYFAAEKNTGMGGSILRQLLGHWRSFEVVVFDQQRQPQLELRFPFRWFFKTLLVREKGGRSIGRLQQRFSLIYKKFDLYDSRGVHLGQIKSPLWKLWTFELRKGKKKLGTVQKKWSGALGELFTDKDNFVVSFADRDLTQDTKILLLSTCLMVDIVYFENNEGKSFLSGLFD